MTKKVKDNAAWKKEIADELDSLPKGAVVDTGGRKVVKLGNGVWGGDGSEYDPRYQMSESDLAKKLETNALMYSKAPTYEVGKRKAKGNPAKVKVERMEYAKKVYPTAKITAIKSTRNYTDYTVDRGEKSERYRVYESRNGNRYGCPLRA